VLSQRLGSVWGLPLRRCCAYCVLVGLSALHGAAMSTDSLVGVTVASGGQAGSSLPPAVAPALCLEPPLPCAHACRLLRMMDPESRTPVLRAFCYKQLVHVLIVGGGLFSSLSLFIACAQRTPCTHIIRRCLLPASRAVGLFCAGRARCARAPAMCGGLTGW
jgi:hypothetical protein